MSLCHLSDHARLGANEEKNLEWPPLPVTISPNRQYSSNGLLCNRSNSRSREIPAEVTLAVAHGGWGLESFDIPVLSD